MARYRYPLPTVFPTVVDQSYKTLHETLEEYLHTGVLDVKDDGQSFDFNNADEVDFSKPLPTDVDLYDAAAGIADPFDSINVKPLTPDPTPDPTSDPTSDPTPDPIPDPE